MSNQEVDPPEVVAVDLVGHGIDILQPREVPLGGPRAMTVRRTLPQRGRSLIGAWCFVDHYGPDDVTQRPNMDVPPHPHTGLQTVSWLFQGEIEHRDSLGSHAAVRPGVVPEPVRLGAATVRVFIGELAGATSPARVFSPLVGAQVNVPAGATVSIPVNATFEHGVLVDAGEITLNGERVPLSHLAYVAPGTSDLTIEATTDARLLLIGGAPFGEQIVMWWNFIGRSHEEIVGFRQQWQSEVIDGHDPDGRFGTVAGYPGRPLPAPELPNVRLTPRG